MHTHRFVLLAALSSSPAFAQTNLIQNSGAIGIGTTSPEAALHVVGRPIFQGGQSAIVHRNGNADTIALTGVRNDVAGESNFTFYGYGANWIFHNGSVGIGTINPANRLSVNGAIGVGADELRIQQSNFGYSSTYRVLRMGDDLPLRSLALNVDPLTVSGGQFSGRGQILIGHGSILTPNASTSDWVGVLRALNNRVQVGGQMSSGELLAGSGLTVSNETGHVGVGTANPGAKLVVSEASASSLHRTTAPTPRLWRPMTGHPVRTKICAY